MALLEGAEMGAWVLRIWLSIWIAWSGVQVPVFLSQAAFKQLESYQALSQELALCADAEHCPCAHCSPEDCAWACGEAMALPAEELVLPILQAPEPPRETLQLSVKVFLPPLLRPPQSSG